MRRTSWVMMAACLGMLRLVAGCGGSSPSDMGGGDMSVVSGDVTAACAARATAYCAMLQSCTPFSLQRDYKDMNDCIARSSLTCPQRAGLAGSGITAASLNACAQGYASLSCVDFQSGVNFLPAACQPAGTLAAGAVCGDDRQCQSAYCKIGATTCGVCTVKVAEGAACAASADCAAGLLCNTTTKKCATPADTGASCKTAPCKPGLYCDSGSSTCGAGLGVGAACTTTASRCDGAKGYFCDGTTNKCVAEQLAQPGAACNPAPGSRVICGGSSHCYGAIGARTCIPDANDGAACDFGVVSSGPGCRTGAICAAGAMTTKGVCQVSDPTTCK